MKKSINIKIITVILATGLFTTTLTFQPQTLSDVLPAEITQTEALQVAEATPESTPSTPRSSEESSPSVPSSTQTETQKSVTSTPPARPRITSQVSRGGQAPNPSKSVSTSSSSSSSKASAIIATAKNYIGVKYVWGGTTPSGFDCSGYTSYVFAQHGITLPRVSRDQYKVGTPVSYNNLHPGDLVFFSLDEDKVIDHVGIYIGNGQFINASSSKGVTIYTMGSYWKSHYIGAKRVL